MSAPLSIAPGATTSFEVDIEQPNGDPYDLTDFEVNFFVKRSLRDSDAAALFHGTLSSGVAITYTAKDGVVTVTIPKAATALIRLGRVYFWYVKLFHTPTGTADEPIDGSFLATFTDTH